MFLIKFALISIPAYQDVRHPFRREAHDVAKFIHRYIGTAFDDHFVVDMTDNPAEGQIFHGIAEKVAGYCLDNVLHKFRPVRFDTFPLFGRSNTLVGNRFTTKTVFADFRLNIAELSSRR